MSDSVTDTLSPDGSRFGSERVGSLLAGKASVSSDELVRTITGGLSEFRGRLPQQDDVTVLAQRSRGSG